MRGFVMVTAIAVTLFSSPLSAGMVLFDPPVYWFYPGESHEIEIEVSVVADSGSFQSLDMVKGSRHLGLVDFKYSQLFSNEVDFSVVPGPAEIYPSDLFVGGFFIEPQETPFYVGTLVLDLSARVLDLSGGSNPEWEMTYFVDSSQDGGFSSIGSVLGIESLAGSGSMGIVSEPATATLLFLSAAFVCYYRHFLGRRF